MREFEIVVAADEEGGIGRDGDLPWRLPGDTAFLKRITTETSDDEKRNAVVMGRKTYETIPPRFRPLKKRLNAVVTRQSDYAAPDEVVVSDSLGDALGQIAARGEAIERVFVLGGGEIYRQAIDHPRCQRIHITRVEGSFGCDTHFPAIDEQRYRLVHASERQEENGIGYVFQRWERLPA